MSRPGASHLYFAPETGLHAPLLRCSVFHADGMFVLRLVTGTGASDERTYGSMDDALDAIRGVYREMTQPMSTAASVACVHAPGWRPT